MRTLRQRDTAEDGTPPGRLAARQRPRRAPVERRVVRFASAFALSASVHFALAELPVAPPPPVQPSHLRAQPVRAHPVRRVSPSVPTTSSHPRPSRPAEVRSRPPIERSGGSAPLRPAKARPPARSTHRDHRARRRRARQTTRAPRADAAPRISPSATTTAPTPRDPLARRADTAEAQGFAHADGPVHTPRLDRAHGSVAAAGAEDRNGAPTQPDSTTVACDEGALAQRVEAVLRAALRYPRLARRRHLEGTAVVELRWEPSARAPEVRLVASSGARLLDEAAIDAARRARWPAFAAQCLRRRAALRVPIRFTLRP